MKPFILSPIKSPLNFREAALRFQLWQQLQVIKTFVLVSTLAVFGFGLGACSSSNNSQSPQANAQPQAGVSLSASPVPKNSVLDLTIAAPTEPQTDSHVFDESVIFAPNFAVNQNDPALSNLFSAEGKSNLCFPTALAENLIYLFAYHQPPYSALALSGLSAGGKSIDPNALVEQLASLCHTDPNNGTEISGEIACVSAILATSGYGMGNTQLISPFTPSDSGFPVLTREVAVDDIRASIKGGVPALLEVGWYEYDAQAMNWVRANGHFVGVYGYDYDLSWGENEIQLKVINPETNYGPSRQAAFFDTIMMQRFSPQPGITYPSLRPYILSGKGFSSTIKRGYVGTLLTLAPAY